MDMTRINRELLAGAIAAVSMWLVLAAGEVSLRQPSAHPLYLALIVAVIPIVSVVLAGVLLYLHLRLEPMGWINGLRPGLFLALVLMLGLSIDAMLGESVRDTMPSTVVRSLAVLLGSGVLYYCRQKLVKPLQPQPAS